MISVFYFLIALIILVLGMGFYLASSLAYIRKKPDISLENFKSTQLNEVYSNKVREWLCKIEKKYVKVLSPYLYKLNVLFIENKDADKWIFLLHGVTLSHKYMIELAYFYHNAGYSVAIWDSRGHGNSGGKTTTYGYYEQYDVKAIVDYIRKTYGDKCKIGLHGISMGAGIMLMYASHVRDDCNFYIADCPYSNFSEQVITVSSKKIHLKGFPLKIIFETGNLILRILYKFDTKKINILSKIHRIKNPILFFDCRDDSYINPNNTKQLHEKAGSEINDIIWFDEGGHGGSFYEHPDEYENFTLKFLNKLKF